VQVLGKTAGIATDEDDFACAAIALLPEPFGKRFGIVLLSVGVEEKHGCGAICVEAFDGGFAVAEFIYFDGAGMRDTFDVIVENGAQFGTSRFAEHEEAKFHLEVIAGRIFFFFPKESCG
jgi:hypothetical protein